jgi:hypothetical protein
MRLSVCQRKVQFSTFLQVSIRLYGDSRNVDCFTHYSTRTVSYGMFLYSQERNAREGISQTARRLVLKEDTSALSLLIVKMG